MAARISRAKQQIKAAGSQFRLPAPGRPGERLRVVLHVLYLIFNEGYTASSGNALHRADLAREAIRLTRLVHRLLPADSEVAGLLALMLLTDSRRARPDRPRRRADPARRAGPGPLGRAASSPRAPPWSAPPWAARRSARTSSRRPSPRPTPTPRTRRTPTGIRCTRCTGSSSGSPPTRWSRSTARSRWPRPAGPAPGSSCWPRWTATRGWPATTGCTRSGRTCWSRPATRRPRGRATSTPLALTASLAERRYLESRAARLGPARA